MGVQEAADVLIVDDHPVVRRGLKQLLAQETDLAVCGEAANARETFKQVDKQRPDVIVLDISLGEDNGIPLIRDIHTRFGRIPILVLSIHDETLYAERAIQAGASGYLMKEVPIKTVTEAIRRVLRGEIHLSEKMSTRLVHRMMNRHADIGDSPLDCLSNRELEVFELIGHGRGTRQIAERLCVSIKTVETHRSNIKRKLDLHNAIELLQYATHWVDHSSNEDS